MKHSSTGPYLFSGKDFIRTERKKTFYVGQQIPDQVTGKMAIKIGVETLISHTGNENYSNYSHNVSLIPNTDLLYLGRQLGRSVAVALIQCSLSLSFHPSRLATIR